jgi:hypothetical protein
MLMSITGYPAVPGGILQSNICGRISRLPLSYVRLRLRCASQQLDPCLLQPAWSCFFSSLLPSLRIY